MIATGIPSRCPSCQSRLLQPHSIMDTFERYDVAYWQCVSCGLTFDCSVKGKRNHITLHSVRRVTLAPGELNELTKESHRRTIGNTLADQRTAKEEI